MKRALLLTALALSGCEVFDQTVFAPSPEALPVEPTIVVAAPPKIDPRTALVVIEYAAPNPKYRETLGLAVRAAEARDKRVRYDVIAVAKTIDGVGSARAQAAEIMRAMMQEGVPASRIALGLRAEPAIPNTQVRVYVR